jgi:hypothetical protein
LRSDFGQDDIPDILKQVSLIDVGLERDRLNFRSPLVGARMNLVFGRDFAGQKLTEEILDFAEVRRIAA